MAIWSEEKLKLTFFYSRQTTVLTSIEWKVHHYAIVGKFVGMFDMLFKFDLCLTLFMIIIHWGNALKLHFYTFHLKLCKTLVTFSRCSVLCISWKGVHFILFNQLYCPCAFIRPQTFWRANSQISHCCKR